MIVKSHGINSSLSLRVYDKEEADMFIKEHEINLHYARKLYDVNRKLIYSDYLPSRSILTNFIKTLFINSVISSATQDFTDILSATINGQSLANNSAGWVQFNVNGAANDDTNGIVIGIGTNAVAAADVKLQTQTLHGIGAASKVDYKLVTFDQPVVGATSVSFTIRRIFTNTSGGAISVSECGLYALARMSVGTTIKICIVRDVDTPMSFPNNTSMEVDYIWTVNV